MSERGPGAVLSSLGQTLSLWLEEFLEDMRRRNYSNASLRVYGYDLKEFVQWVSQQETLDAPGDLTPEVLEKYQMHLMLRPSRKGKGSPKVMSAGARNRQTAELRSFFRYLKRSCKLLGNPGAELESARQPRNLPKSVLTVEEMARLLAAIPKEKPSDLRDWVAIELLYATGLRRSELLHLELSALRLGEELIHVLGKGRKERVLPIGTPARQALERYLREGRPRLSAAGHSYVLASRYHGGPVSEKELITSIRQHAQQAGISSIRGFHQFRHTCATHLLRGGADLRCIQTLLGHTNLNTTAIYTKVEVSDLRKTMKECHPREQDQPPSST